MPVTELDPTVALVVIDLQNGIVALPTAQPIAEVIARAARLATAFRERDRPVILVNVAGAPTVRTEHPRVQHVFSLDWTDLIPELNRQPQDHVVTKHTPGAFTDTGLAAHLGALGVTHIVIGGVSTSNGVEVTARQAHELGLNITFAIDAMADRDAAAHAYCATRIFPRLGETGTTADIIDLLERSARP